MKYRMIQDPRYNGIPVSRKAELLGVNRRSYYKWLQRSQVDPQKIHEDMQLRDALQRIALEFPRYGYRRMTVELGNRGYQVNHKKVLRLMREDNLLCIRKRFKPLTTDSNHPHRIYPNLLRYKTFTQPNQGWASDITYIQLQDSFVYLAVILDVYTRKCIGWNLEPSLDTSLALNALHQALHYRWHPSITGLIHHSDQGVQYASHTYVNLLKTHGIQISMSRKANPYDNAFVESFIKTLKYEEVYLKEYRSFTDVIENIGDFIDRVYNKKRLHSSLGYKSPEVFEMEVKINKLT
jgi:transposase InsO family protein